MVVFSTRRKTGGSLYEKGVYPADFTEEFKEYIRRRDGDRCSVCGHKRRPREQQLDVHHINFRKETRKTNCISLCRDCHSKIHAQQRRRWAWKEWLWNIAAYREKILPLTTETKRHIVNDMREAIKESP